MLILLILIPLFVLQYARLQQRRQRNLAKLGSLGFVQQAGGGMVGARRWLPLLLFLVGLAVMLVALARPQAVVGLPSMESVVMLAFDVSGSMAADDMAPSRLEAAKMAAQGFVLRQPDAVKIGVVAFSDGGMAVQLPTNDQEVILAAINRLSLQRGTSLANGILASLQAIAAFSGQPPPSADPLAPDPTPTPMPQGTFIPASIVLITDGENTVAPDPLDAAQEAANRGVRIHTIGVGSAAGAALEIDGFLIFTMLDEPMLQNIARLTEGSYFNAQNESDLLEIYASLDPQWVIKNEKMEITSIFAGASMLILLVGGLFSLLWYGRIP
jgi:Ca-activated chloride channel family protein